MHTRSISYPENRSVADTHKGNGVSLPAAQLYDVRQISSVDHRVSEYGNMAVKDSGNPDHFFAKEGTLMAPKVLVESGDGPMGMKKQMTNVPYVQDCSGCLVLK
jgi:hypothetical protein